MSEGINISMGNSLKEKVPALENMQRIFEKEGTVYFLGIGGIGMSALARFFKSKGRKVSGYDKTPTALTGELQAEGIAIHFEDDISQLDKDAEIVVYTPAVPKDLEEYNFFKEKGYNLLKRSEVLGLITAGSFTICVAGTHGKTTTSAMIAHILRHTGFGCNAFLGGIASNYGTNFWASNNNVAVAEADEYDRSFLQLFPDVAIITAMDADHLDIYKTAENLENAFIEFASQVKPGGLLISKFGLTRANEFKASEMMTYSSRGNKADSYPENIVIKNGSYYFDMVINKKIHEGFVLNMGGMHNIENAVAAITVAEHLGIDVSKIKSAVDEFKGVKRRFEFIVKNDEVIMVDDYAHHPEELRSLISGAKELFPGKKCTVIFQPHLYSRTKDFADGFAEVLSLADDVILLPVYPAREKPIEGVNSEMILNMMTNSNKQVLSKEQVLEWAESFKHGLLLTAGAGDIDTLIEPIKNIIENRMMLK